MSIQNDEKTGDKQKMHDGLVLKYNIKYQIRTVLVCVSIQLYSSNSHRVINAKLYDSVGKSSLLNSRNR